MLVLNRGYSQYLQTQVQTAAPGDLILLLYNGAIRFLNRARVAMDEQDIEVTHVNLIKAENIILELSHALDLSVASVSANLSRVYDYMYRRLVEANINKDPQIVDEVAGLMRELLSAWEQAIQQNQTTIKPAGSLSGVPTAPSAQTPSAPPSDYRPWSLVG